MKKIITYGTFDLLHYGHIQLLKRAKALGDYLIVGLSSDEFNKLKGKKSVLSYQERVDLLSAIKYIDEIIPENNWEQKSRDVINNNVSIFVMGDDWKGQFDDLSEYCDVLYLERTPEISSSSIKQNILNKEKLIKM
ncbi:glycerol-3-phosphate cytidylyltransferase [Paenibacillus terrigena]|uniref:glycerol-3-phosphate cytidylyltransferase n=1 Tax=Paenibacillus terrigena TaxID=369333 RepID=UPI000368FD6C|nr:glycerol-3-phosphate cytidylyltransferase [Paenibacillus terrigena]